MTEYRNLLPDVADPNAIEEAVVEAIQDRFPDWEPAEGNLETWIIRALSVRLGELLETATDVADEIFVTYGDYRGIPRYSPERAVADSTWTFVDDAGYTIPAGAQVAIPRSGNEFVAFEVAEETTVASGSTTAAVPLVALEPGADGNGLTDPPELIDALVYVDSIALDAATSGGVDEEELADYLSRLRDRLRVATETPILPTDFETIARTFHPFVGRAIARDGYNPADDTDDNARMITLAVTDADGEALSAGEKTEVEETLESLRETNFVVNVVDADYTEIDVEFTIAALDGFDASTVRSSVEAELTRYLSPDAWGLRLPRAGVPAESGYETTVRYLEIASVIDRVPGVDYVVSLAIALDGDTPGNADLTLTGGVPLTRPGTFS